LSLTAKDIAEITRLLEDSSFDELELEMGGMKIYLRRGDAAVPAPRVSTPAAASAPTTAAPAPVRAAAGHPGLDEVRAPLLGTFYRAPRPGAPPFVEVGARVEPDTIVGIIEVMKLMNTVRAGVRGVVREICAADATLVEYGATLLRVDARSAD
jgi:acetyl-CoA carboxylase biotin carboxyl carrier protein